ncbi:LytR/AlgR family response regulator transcription factor [Pandoraea apista]|uniref:Response regulator transcription factor n=1 Tax=Pandoraea apista TaxID=93218 RepID=A0ABX9ZRS4_9BURK|nr:LytTR family DNA-binding domain-containing protein [Pandoraea apista]PTE01667.1 DNA-binding response regulator [Pandoraea apista]RRJ27835.1 DNA-binding response regulator [Pandoraea apista]RRJ79476.1 DNA-binding response regulator [Pandoraea apista]RSD15207.1 response regulator transcription factor [Pandoraea apista]RSD22462.1 response regulator transcription factor [Pandoraea apista]
MTSPVALIAEDEPLLADALRTMLAQTWPALHILPVAPDGTSAIAAIAQAQPDVVFLDISMPGATGLEVARACARLVRPPQIVFVTAFDRFALDAFDAAAVDYLLKPVEPDRLARTVARVRERLAAPDDGALSQLVETLRTHLEATGAVPDRQGAALAPGTSPATESREYLRFVRASVRDEIRIVPVEDVCFFEAADKYVVVATTDGDLLIRTSLRELMPQLDPSRFWQVHRSTVVNVAEVVSAQHTPLGRLTLKLRRRKDRVAVSRQYAHLFRQM